MLTGFPIKEYECQIFTRKKKEDGTYAVSVAPKTVWLNDKQIDGNTNPNIKYQPTGKTRTSYAKPAWVPEFNENGNILLLDDMNRANQSILKAGMDLILEQKYVSWSLPKGTTIVITQNPDDGNYNVESQDEAQVGRYMDYLVDYDLDAWTLWAEKAKLDGRCINFVMNYSGELFNADEDGNRICNPRSYVMFANMISGIKDWDNPDNLNFIQTIAKGCFKDEGGRFNKIFASFIRNKMHLLIQPKEILLGKWDEVKKKLEDTVYDSNGQYRPDLASILERRFVNFVSYWLESDAETPISKVKDRILDFMNNKDIDGTPLFSEDLMLHMVKTITSDHKKQTGKLLYEPRIAKLVAA